MRGHVFFPSWPPQLSECKTWAAIPMSWFGSTSYQNPCLFCLTYCVIMSCGSGVKSFKVDDIITTSLKIYWCLEWFWNTMGRPARRSTRTQTKKQVLLKRVSLLTYLNKWPVTYTTFACHSDPWDAAKAPVSIVHLIKRTSSYKVDISSRGQQCVFDVYGTRLLLFLEQSVTRVDLAADHRSKKASWILISC